MYKLIVLLSVVCLIKNIYSTSNEQIFRARVDSCPSCSLNRLPEVMKFIYEDLPKYGNVEFKRIQGAKPELVLLDEEDNELERIPLSELNRQQCNELLTSKGFSLKNDEL